MNPAIHVAQFAAAWAVVRNNQQHSSQNTEKQEMDTPQIITCISISLIVVVCLIIIWYKMGIDRNRYDYTGEYFKIRLKEIEKNLNRRK